MFHKMHKIFYREMKSMVASVYVLKVWAWEHFPMTRPIYEDMRQPHEPYIRRYSGQMTHTKVKKTKENCTVGKNATRSMVANVKQAKTT